MKKASVLIWVFLCFVISGCAAMRDAKQYEMKKSPCACIEFHIV